MRVLFVYKLLTMGGVETVLRTRLESLPPSGIDAHVWFLFDGPGRVIFEGLESRVHIGSTGLLRGFLQEQDFDLISSIDTEEIFPILRRLRHQPPLVIEAHTPYIENLEYLRFLEGLTVAAYFVPSEYQSEVIRERVGEGAKIAVIPNPLAASFEREILKFSPCPPAPAVAWIGRLDDLKNWQEFIQIGKRVKEKASDVEFWIVGRPGEGDISSDLYRRARRARILEDLKWFRGLPYKHVPTLLDAVRSSGGVVVSTSKGDSFGMTVAEAMSRACAVLVPSQGPFGEFVREGQHGLSYPLGNPNEAAIAILDLLGKDELRSDLGNRARQHILERHGTEAAVQALAQQLRSLIKDSQDMEK